MTTRALRLGAWTLFWLSHAWGQHQADLAYLLDGVKEIGTSPNQGSLCVFSDQAFAVVDGKTVGGAEAPAIAATRFGKGRMVAMTSYVESTSFEVADTGKLMLNVGRWAAGQKKDARAGVYKLPGLAARLRGIGLDARDITVADRSTVDVIFVPPREVSAGEIPLLMDYVNNGGGLVAGALGWVWQANHPHQSLVRDFAGTRMFAPAGIVWTFDGLLKTTDRGYSTKKPPAELAHARKALDAVQTFAGQFLSMGESGTLYDQIYATLFAAARSLPLTDKTLRPQLEQMIGPAIRTVPSLDQPVHRDWLRGRLAVALETSRLQQLPPEQVKAHPAAAKFPGSVPASAPRVTRQVIVHASKKRWGAFGTGLYAAPGELVTVQAPESVLGREIELMIGSHSDSLWENEKWHRYPEIVTHTPISDKKTKAANGFGGLIYVVVPKDAVLGDFSVTISGAVEAPRFVLGETSLDEWRQTIRKRPAPWGELVSDRIVLTSAQALLREVDDPAALLEMWNHVVEVDREFAALPREQRQTQWLVPDVQTELDNDGMAMHSGYPIVSHLGGAKSMLDREKLLACHGGSGMGWYHELGHNSQVRDWVFKGAGESMANLFAVYVYSERCGFPADPDLPGSKRWRERQLASYDFAKPDFTLWQKDTGHTPYGLVMYVELQQAFGWNAFKKVFAEYRALPENERPKDDAERRDQWMVRFSRQVGHNLGPFFAAWGVPVSDTARKSVADLPVWMPEELQKRSTAGQ